MFLKVPNHGGPTSQKEQRVARSHSLKETPACRKEKKEVQQQRGAGGGGGLPGSLKQKITNVLCPDRQDEKDGAGGRGSSHPPQPTPSAVQQPSLYTALDSCLYHAAHGMLPFDS